MSDLYDLTGYSAEERYNIIYNRYRGHFKLIGRKSPVISRVVSLNNNSKPNPEKLAVVEGIWALNLVIKHGIKIKYFIVSPEKIKSIEAQDIIEACMDNTEGSYIVSENTYDYISEQGNSSGITAVIYMPRHELSDLKPKKNSIVIVLDGLEIPGNVGTILRSCDATAIDAVLITNKKTRMNHPKLIRSSMGACFTIPVIECEYAEVFDWLKSNEYNVVLTDTAAKMNYYDYDYQNRIAIVMGSEKYGIADEWYDQDYTGISIPMLGCCDSLNVGVAATIILYEASMKNKGMMKERGLK